MSVREQELGSPGAVRAADAFAEERMFRRPSEWRSFWEAFSRDRLAVGAAAAIVLVSVLAAAGSA